jgi:hypothetical protein
MVPLNAEVEARLRHDVPDLAGAPVVPAVP